MERSAYEKITKLKIQIVPLYQVQWIRKFGIGPNQTVLPLTLCEFKEIPVITAVR